jgi:hypothetical protein
MNNKKANQSVTALFLLIAILVSFSAVYALIK